ncbi:aspartate kinase [Flavihumibacter fluvii]|uniref:aspartate kinase n=1 Tax=Flavihumibacter fluvii TaxID=2838157 RepID=UPI001BDF124F|nr:aspartate kinase [Flavihumibacter fluvii]ULQ54337.1 aspartate kinase [Flavihumibacter fluvii]
MRVFKFGGASVSSIDRINQVAQIVRQYEDQPLLIVISAMGKTTNALEKVAESFYAERRDEALQLFDQVKQQHLTTAKYLLVKEYLACEASLVNFFTEVEWLLYDKPVRGYDYYYDQIVCIGELLSTAIMSAFLNEVDVKNTWIDVRDIIRTDDHFRDANIDWDFTQQKVDTLVKPLFAKTGIVVTQGFIGATDENESVTLGREGSDYTAAVFANMLDAESQTIWKDVEGVMNADPKKFPEAQLIAELNYAEVIEMAFYGAQVIHPKTIKPLQNKGIPLLVKCFLDPTLPGTIIHNQSISGLPPIIVVKEHQALIHLKSRDFSFVGEKTVGHLYHLFEELSIKPNLTQNGAISFVCCVDDRPDKIEQLALEASAYFDVSVEKGLRLLTVRHYTPEVLAKLVGSNQVVLQQQSPETAQVLMR